MVEYYTYLDVLDQLRDFSEHTPPPIGAIRADATPSRLVISASQDSDFTALSSWLVEAFGPRYNANTRLLTLEAVQSAEGRKLPVDLVRVEPGDPNSVQIRLRPTLSKPRYLAFSKEYDTTVATDIDVCPPVMTFHSFKGGMGRTTLALAFADALVARKRKVLFVDGDFEAPGISTMLSHIMPSPRVSFADLLSLAHSDPEPLAQGAIDLVAERLQDQDVDGIVILPCTRDLGLPNIAPEALTFSKSRSAFFVGDLLARLGQKIEADLVIVDLRAGLSELSASLFLDPRLEHVLVTTLNGQAIDGTITLLNEMHTIADDWKTATGQSLMGSLTVVVNQAPSGLASPGAQTDSVAGQGMAILDEALRKISDARPPISQQTGSANPFFDRTLVPVVIENVASVDVLPRDLSAARKLLADSPLHKQMLEKFADIVPVQEVPPFALATGVQQKRRNLEAYAKEAVFAESGAKAEIFPTKSLLNLVDRHQRSLPTVVVLGDKGAGKTYTFMSLALSTTWREFAKRVSPSSSILGDDLILPVTPPQDLGDSGRARERAITLSVAAHFSKTAPLGDQQIADAIENQKTSASGESLSSWREFWLDLIAWRCGIDVLEAGAFERLIAMPKTHRIVAIFDGIETLFSNIKTSSSERTAVEALLRAVPDWLAQIPDRPFGTVIFMREDVARAALPNNFKQFEDRYGAYSLKWNWAEASALAFWIAQQAHAVDSIRRPNELVEMDEEMRGAELEALWGLKMGPNTSREARSQEWVMSSLSDFNRRIKARDLVRFIYEASQRSKDDHSYYDGRVLSPRAMRDAIDPCSEARVDETGEENTELKGVFSKITQLANEDRELPWRLDSAISYVGPDAVRVLEENGILFRDKDEYYVPELYRHGLRFYYSGGARRKVITLMRRAPAYE